MVLLLVTILCSSIVASSNEVASWKENFYVKSGKYQEAYKIQVFQSNFAGLSNASEYCKEISKTHDYDYPGSHLSHMTGYSVSGFLESNGVGFTNFKNSFERYCYMPCDGMSSFYNRYPRLKKFLWNVPFLNVLIPYWVEGDIVQEIAVDMLKSWLKEDTVASCSKLPDIPLNILYSKDDPLVSKESATFLCEQLKKTGQFPNVSLMRVDKKDGKYVLEPEQIGEAEIAKSVKKHEKRQWWLRHLWVSKLGLILALLPILTKLAITYQSNLLWAFGAFIIQEIVRR